MLIMVMILGISIIVVIIVKEFFFNAEKISPNTITPKSLMIPKSSKVESIYVQDKYLFLIVSFKNESQEMLIIRLEDGVEISRESVKLVPVK